MLRRDWRKMNNDDFEKECLRIEEAQREEKSFAVMNVQTVPKPAEIPTDELFPVQADAFMKCYRCQKLGHKVANCLLPDTRPKCTGCGVRGHPLDRY